MRVPWVGVRMLCWGGAVASLAAAGVLVYPDLAPKGKQETQSLPTVPTPSGDSGEKLRDPERYALIHRKLDLPDDPPPPPMPTRLPVILISIMRDPGGEDTACFRNSKQTEKWRGVGQSVEPDGVEVVEIRDRSVQVKWQGRLWVLDMKSAAPPPVAAKGAPEGDGAPATEQKYEVSREKLQEYMAQMDKYMRQMDYGWPHGGGVEIKSMAADAEARHYGFQAKDVIKKVNGQAITGFSSALKMFQEMGANPSDTFVVEGNRGTQTFRTEIKIKQ